MLTATRANGSIARTFAACGADSAAAVSSKVRMPARRRSALRRSRPFRFPCRLSSCRRSSAPLSPSPITATLAASNGSSAIVDVSGSSRQGAGGREVAEGREEGEGRAEGRRQLARSQLPTANLLLLQGGGRIDQSGSARREVPSERGDRDEHDGG